ncbi:recombinase family protein [Cytobacillus sp. S13-E01]|uniref:recombinase family protein n=1 Tax=Cytobacillus sp. S13-E01 TaxID=3031326 RepID=UPI0023D87B02|nr:recombinase family protein [Cytobacillus sp. S13-E01]MDF0728919.1 recombinase family protein [Cytobacillus sp. S13-E01]
MKKKRTWILYRVSTKKQVSADDDIPMQKKACHEFVETHPDWEITNELYEKGLSGWKLTADNRDELMKIKAAAENKEFDVLVVFLFDRLGRREQETPFIVQFLVEQGVEVWSAKEGQARIEDHADILINFIRFWQASGESHKISLRSRESKEQLAKEGYNQGGIPPYGYKLIETEIPHWKVKDRNIKEEVPDKYEAEVVKMVYDLYVNKHYGYRKIVDYLNENGYRTRENKHFGVSTIQRILQNPVYIGKKRYKSYRGKDGDTQPYNEKLHIIDTDLFEKAQQIKNMRKNALTEQDKTGIPMGGKLIFSGLAFCKYCGSRLVGNYLYRKSQKPNKKDEYYTTIIYRYRCPANKGTYDHEQNIWGALKYDKIIISHIKEILRNMDISVFIDKSIDNKKEKVKSKEVILKNLQKEQEGNKKQLQKLNEEIANALMGESSFTPDQLSGAIQGIEIKIRNSNEIIERIENELAQEKENYSDVRNMAEELRNWEKKFDQADDDLKKVMLSRIIHKVHFGKESINIELNAQIEEIMAQIEE